MNKLDKLNNLLNIGDTVVYSKLGSELYTGTIYKFTKKLVYIQDNSSKTRRSSNRVIKINK